MQILLTLKLETPKKVLEELNEIICNAFKNPDGEIKNSHKISPYHFLFEGTETDLKCLYTGLENLTKNKIVMKYTKAIAFDENEDADIYKIIIQLKENISHNLLNELTTIINDAYDNRASKIERSSFNSPYDFVYTGNGELAFQCLTLGVVNLSRNKLFLNNVSVWKWIEYDVFECDDLIDLYSKYM